MGSGGQLILDSYAITMFNRSIGFLAYLVCLGIATPIWASSGDSTQVTGEYDVVIALREIDSNSMRVMVDLTVNVSTPAGNGVVLIPMHAPQGPDLLQYVKSTPSRNNVLFGHIRPDNVFAVIGVSQTDADANLTILIKNVQFPIQRTESENTRVDFPFLIDRSYTEVREAFPDLPVGRLRDVIIDGEMFGGSEPEAKVSTVENQHLITISPDRYSTTSVLITLREKEGVYLLYLFLGGFGFLTGILSGPRFVRSKNIAIAVLPLAAIGLGGSLYYLFVILDPKRRVEADIIIIFGAGAGILCGYLWVAIQRLRSGVP